MTDKTTEQMDTIVRLCCIHPGLRDVMAALTTDSEKSYGDVLEEAVIFLANENLQLASEIYRMQSREEKKKTDDRGFIAVH